MPQAKLNSQSEKTLRLCIRRWTRSCRALYNRQGVYAVYKDDKSGTCLYIGQSNDLGDMVSRFFRKQRFNEVHVTKNPGLMAYVQKQPFYVEVTEMQVDKAWPPVVVQEKLDSLERVMIKIKKPQYNKKHNG